MEPNACTKPKLNLPFVGFCTFAKSPIVEQGSAYQADFAVIGAPFDMGCQYRSGARFGPRAIRQASTLFSFGHHGAYDHELDTLFLAKDKVNIVDVGDVDIVHTDTYTCLNNIQDEVKAILSNKAIPVVLGGDHAITAAVLAAYGGHKPIHIVQIDAHLDFVDERHGVRYGHGNCMRRASEMPHVSGLTQLGIRNVSSSSQSDYVDAINAGSNILSVRQFRQSSIEDILATIPKGEACYITIDIDGFDPSIAPGTGTPSHGGFQYYEVLEFLRQLCQHTEVVGIDLCEVSPPYDPAEVTATLAAQLLMNLIGYVSHYASQGESHA
ncbi:agmatinase [Vibrio celticus]|uniref:Proclavaminate amidinohydrolase n=1 Tax=Vibrio celticus TaxID=446372 RepID=A0A1C3JG60_9VIBR|nr:agmatinase [Vibrio celticus]SBT14072.1 Proclavaminate amidinohydrolase [Vibrio celticus]